MYKAQLWDDVVALKLLHSEDEATAGLADRHRAQRELAVLKALRHPNVVQARALYGEQVQLCL